MHEILSEADRERLAAILGMLGSAYAGERSAAALQAEAFMRKRHMTWADLLAVEPPTETAPEPPQWTPPSRQEPEPSPPPPPAASVTDYVLYGWDGWRVFSVAWMGVVVAVCLSFLQHLLAAHGGG
jgi:hypothetical protein